MHPIERLRYVARSGDVDPGLLAQEAADALGSLARDPRALVPSCRRLIEFHPTCAPLWWVCARILVSDDVRSAADTAGRLLYDDPTGEELAATFPAGATVASRAGSISAYALGARPDLGIRIVGTPSELRWGMRRIDGDVTGYDTTEADEACSGATLVLLEPLAVGPSGALIDGASATLAASATRSGVDVWIAAGEGRLLPTALFDALVHHIGIDLPGEPTDEELVGRSGRHARNTVRWEPMSMPSTLPAAAITAVVGPTGAAHASVGLARATCPAPTELLVPSQGM